MKLSHTKSQKGRDAKFHVLTPKTRNSILFKSGLMSNIETVKLFATIEDNIRLKKMVIVSANIITLRF